MILSFLFAFAATFGFSLLFHVPKKHLVTAALIGAVGWIIYSGCTDYGYGKPFACFMAACLVGVLGDICSRTFKEASTIFVIPGILPLVPGAGIYYTMVAIIEGDLERMAETGTETLLMAGAIAVGLMTMGSLLHIIVAVERKITAPLRRRKE
ncbi:MAG: threonine/serine exporter family protein [Clostridia bacterium]|nr:threonine/serine exporter family protein [Clostridia bacterium]